MNYKQKLGYTALGAVIMLVGLGLGAIVAPPLIAQNNGVFDTIECSTLAVLDEHGNPGIIIAANEDGNGILLYDQAERKAAILYARGESRRLSISNSAGTTAVSLGCGKDGSNLTLNNDEDEMAISLDVVHGVGRFVAIYNEEEQGAITLTSHDNFAGNRVTVRDKTGKEAIDLMSSILGNRIAVHDEAGNKSWEAP